MNERITRHYDHLDSSISGCVPVVNTIRTYPDIARQARANGSVGQDADQVIEEMERILEGAEG